MRRAGIAVVWLWCCLWWSMAAVAQVAPAATSAPAPVPGTAGAVTPASDPAPEAVVVPQPRQIGVLDGLPSNRVNALAEDRQGYLWIATRDGLARYDGVGFRVWRVEDGLRDNTVWSVHVDDGDRVWVGTRHGGLAMLDARRGAFQSFDRSRYPMMGVDDIWSITTTPDGAVWFGTAESGLYRLDPDGAMRVFRPDPADPRSLPSVAVGQLVVDAAGTLWIGTKDGVARWTGRDFERVAMPGTESQFVNGFALDAARNLWIGAQGGGAVRRADGRVEAMPWVDPVLHKPALHMLLQDRQGAHWLDTRSGLAREVDGRVEDVPLYSNGSRGHIRPSWSSAYEDREGGIWFASTDAGLWYLPANWRDFTALQRRIDDPASPANAFVYGMAAASRDGLWLVGSGGVLDWLDPRTGRIEHRLTQVCGSQLTWSVTETTNRILWIGCMRQLVRFDPAGNQVRRWFHGDEEDAALPGDITNFVELRDGTLWISSDQGVQHRDPDGRVLDSVTSGDGRGLPASVRILHIVRAPDGGLWLATTRGVFMWNDGSREFEPVPGGPQRHVNSVAQRGEDTVWLSGLGVLEEYDWNGAVLTLRRTIDAADGLPRVMPGGMAVDEGGTVWMTTVRGLVRFDPQRERMRIYGVRDGLPSQELSEQQIGVSADGFFAVGTADGMLLFHPRNVQWRDGTPRLVVETLEVRRDDARVELPHFGRLRLRHDDRDLRVVARLLSFTDAHAHRYRFQLDGYDPGWIESDDKGARVFPRLQPGEYTLLVEARTADGDWTSLDPIRIDVAPPWWRTGWALCIAVLLLILAILWLARMYRRRLKRRHAWQLAEEKRELAEQASLAKTRFLATLGHEVRTPMTGVLGMGELLAATDLDERQRGYVASIRRAGDHLMRLVNDALDLARIEAGRLSLDVQPFDLRALLGDVDGLMAPVARSRGLAFEVGVADGVPDWVAGDNTRLRQILLNLLGNAIKFTAHGGVSLQVDVDADGALRMRVRDTGPGLSEEQRQRLFRRFEQADGARTATRYGGSGLGLAISQELAAAMGGRIDVESAPGEGACFIVTLPLAAAEAQVVPAAAAVADSMRAAAALELLLVEDDPTVAEVVSGLLRAQGHYVTHAPHGLAALSELAVNRFDIVMLDLDLPGLDGLALARQLRARGWHGPLLAVTARADAEAEPAAREAGFDGFLRKPLTGALLADAIERLLPAVQWKEHDD